ncbi:glycine--tRNA ligase [Candidatus Parcubacteria bacterium]|jgi:glycyl-tRNA synthetase|nr:glycine--tRNA ligase [Candidatus Parcubacteria bacterium]MBT3948673.1 glycine--tRNA ligase [Candidatus Parcubacteria bacterium]
MLESLEPIVSLAKRRGFIFPGSDIYGGLANSWDYGPLGAQMRMNIKTDWWKQIVEQRADMVGLDGAIMMNPKVWEASGHVDTFNDPLVECKKCNKRFRADTMSGDEKCLKGKDHELSEPRTFNLMFQTSLGKTGDDKGMAYLRPETAQAMFVNFKNVLDTTRKRLPFGIAQIGKAFRNEITPGNFIFRTLEFEQMEIEYFLEEENWEESFESWANWMEEWAASVGINTDMLHRLEVPKKELAHYSKRTLDFEFDFPFGTKELWGLAYRTDFDLKNHEKHSGESLVYSDPSDNKRKIVPHVVEPTFGVDRTLLAMLVSAYSEEEVKGEKRVVMKFKPHMAPYQVAVLPLSKKEELSGITQEIFEDLINTYRCEYDDTGSIGKRYRRQDEIGTPYCVTIDFDSLEDKAVTVRDRDTMEQERISIEELKSYFENKFN